MRICSFPPTVPVVVWKSLLALKKCLEGLMYNQCQTGLTTFREDRKDFHKARRDLQGISCTVQTNVNISSRRQQPQSKKKKKALLQVTEPHCFGGKELVKVPQTGKVSCNLLLLWALSKK